MANDLDTKHKLKPTMCMVPLLLLEFDFRFLQDSRKTKQNKTKGYKFKKKIISCLNGQCNGEIVKTKLCFITSKDWPFYVTHLSRSNYHHCPIGRENLLI